jgi:tetratricopeptide (TPR) repeat protein
LDEVRGRARAGERREALAIIDTFLAESADSPLAPSALLLAGSLETNAERAAERWTRIVSGYDAAPEVPEALVALIRYEFARGFHARVIEDARALAARRDVDEDLLSEGGYWAVISRIAQSEDPARIVPALERIRETPWSDRAAVALAAAFRRSGSPERAIDLTRRASTRRDDDGVACAALYQMAQAHWARRDSSAATEVLRTIRTRCPDTIESVRAGAALAEGGAAALEVLETDGGEARYFVILAEVASLEEAERFVREFTARRSERPSIVAGERFEVSLGGFADLAPAQDLALDLESDGYTSRVEKR